MSKTFNDPLFSAQWYLNNTGQRGGSSRLDINVLSAWDSYTGKGVIVAVNDDGMDLTHPALVANLLTNLAYDSARDTTGQGFVGAGNSHGTVVGSIVGMAGNDGIGGVGVAYDAKIIPGLAIGQGVNAAKLFLANLAAGASVSVNSWGADPAFAENFGASGSQADNDWSAALVRAATEARGGLGMVLEVSGGNERGNKADTSLSNFTGNKLIIAVGALTEMGTPTDYSTPGASLLVSAPGGVSAGDQSLNSGFGIVSADVQGTAGYNTTAGTDGDYAFQNQGTSYSGPMVGGAAALMLQANPKLGFRDVSNILAMTAIKVDPTNASWVQNKSIDWNLGGMHFSRDFGYGLMDVSAAVRLAESWPLAAATMANWISAQGVSSLSSGVIPDNSPTGLTVTASVTDAVRIERMEFDLNLSATSPSQLSATITSPSGTTITLFDQPLTRTLKDGAPDMATAESAWPDTFTIGSTAFLGESSAGNWTLKLTDKVTGVDATYNSLTVRAWGSTITSDSHRVFTNEFAEPNMLVVDTGGTDTMNAAAASAAVQLDLRSEGISKVASGQFTLSAGSVIENAIGGLGNDTLWGNSVGNVLFGGAGNDTLYGMEGNDTLTGGTGDDVIDAGAGIDTAVYSVVRSGTTVTKTGSGYTVSGPEGVDTLTNIERLQFADKTINLTIQAQAAAAPQADVNRISELYVAFFNRVPDADGLSYWISQLGAGQSVTQIAEAFYNAGVQYSSLTGFSAGMSNATFVNVIYKNVLGRSDGADAEGLAYWTGELASGRASNGSLVNTILNSAHSFKGDATYGWVANLLDNKLAVAKTFAIDWGLNYNTPAESISQGMAIAAAVTSTGTTAAIALIGVTASELQLG
jgi:subtilisin-like proprotein convertase family protein